MILVDANLLIYAVDSDSAHHGKARRWLEDVLSGTTPVGLAWVVILAFLRITNGHWAVLRQLLRAVGTAGNLTSDAHLAAMAVERGSDVYSTDGDFVRFPGVRHVNPLVK